MVRDGAVSNAKHLLSLQWNRECLMSEPWGICSRSNIPNALVVRMRATMACLQYGRIRKRLEVTSLHNSLFLKKKNKALELPVFQRARPHQPTWSVEVGSFPTAAAAATGVGTTAMWVLPPRHLSLRWTAALTRAYIWSWSRGRSLMLKSQRYVDAVLCLEWFTSTK